MKKISIGNIVLGGIVAALAFLIAELIVEGIVNAVFNYNEGELLKEHFGGVITSGTQYITVTLVYLLILTTVAIWMYALLLPRNNNWIKTALLVSLIVILLVYVPMLNFVNLGMLPLKVFLMSLLFNLFELPAAVILGSAVYKDKDI